MRKKIIWLLSFASALLCCLGLAACDSKTRLEELKEQGYTISVTYDANGGNYSDDFSLMDIFNPDKFQQTEGEIHIPLKEPTDPTRPTKNNKPITLERDGYFFAGWYEKRTVKMQNGTPVDDNGRALKLLDDGTYVYAELAQGEKETPVIPAYEYDDRWDFSQTWDIKPSEINGALSKTLYAGWVKYYEFNYYYYQEDDAATRENESGWTLLYTQTFDYKTTNAEGSQTADKDTIWLPKWEDGVMDHAHSYANESVYNFPKLTGKTFSKAYLDKERTQEITGGVFEHRGSLDYEHALAINPVENIYVDFTEGEQYKIQTAKQLQNNFNINGWYEITADLDFAEYKWPVNFSKGTFMGKMYSTEGESFAIKNVSVTYTSAGAATCGGLFGELGETAEIKNLTFENVTFDMAVAQLASESNFGLFAGYIQDGATISGVSVGGTFKIGQVSTRFTDYSFHLLANGKTDGITQNTISLQLYGEELGSQYTYTVVPESTTLAANGVIQLQISSSIEVRDQATYDINKEEE